MGLGVSRKWHVSATERALKVGGNKNIYQATHTPRDTRESKDNHFLCLHYLRLAAGHATQSTLMFVRRNNEKYTATQTHASAANVSNLYGARCKRKSISPLKGRWPLIKKEEKNRAYLICPRSPTETLCGQSKRMRGVKKEKGGCSARLSINFLICTWVTLIYL